MQSQVKIFCCLALLGLSWISPAAQAADEGWNLLKSDKVQVLDYSSAQGEVISSYIPYFIDFGRLFWGWDPTKEPKNTSENVYLPQRNSINETMSNLFVEFDVSNTEHFRKVWFQPTPNLKFRGLFGIHDFTKKRPFIIFRMGIHGNVDEMIAERFLARVIYENLDANFLILESLTSHGFLSKNKDISFGGVDEGLQTFFALNSLHGASFDKLVSSYHLLAISMGGPGTFVTALMDYSNEKLIKSVVDFCPLINLKDTVDLTAKDIRASIISDMWNVRRLKALFDIYPDHAELNDWWKTIFDFKPRFTHDVLTLLNEKRKQPLLSVNDLNKLYPNLKWPEGFKKHLETSNSLYELNDFWPAYKGVKTLFTIYTTPKDPLVNNDINSERIFNHTQPGEFKNLNFLRLDRGVHCGLASVYQWDYIVGLVKTGLQL